MDNPCKGGPGIQGIARARLAACVLVYADRCAGRENVAVKGVDAKAAASAAAQMIARCGVPAIDLRDHATHFAAEMLVLGPLSDRIDDRQRVKNSRAR
jgi:hypothetical protein